jgi:hypothetical protein
MPDFETPTEAAASLTDPKSPSTWPVFRQIFSTRLLCAPRDFAAPAGTEITSFLGNASAGAGEPKCVGASFFESANLQPNPAQNLIPWYLIAAVFSVAGETPTDWAASVTDLNFSTTFPVCKHIFSTGLAPLVPGGLDVQ